MKKFVVAEKDIQKAILDYLLMRGHYVWRNNTGGFKKDNYWIRVGHKGSGDIIGYEKGTGRFISIEVKRRGGVLSPEQAEFIRLAQSNGALSCVAYDITNVIELGL